MLCVTWYVTQGIRPACREHGHEDRVGPHAWCRARRGSQAPRTPAHVRLRTGDALDRATGGVLAVGQSTLYPLLYNLESKGLIEGFWRQADETGKERKYYRLTPRGRKRLAEHARQWERLTQALSALGVLSLSPEVAR